MYKISRFFLLVLCTLCFRPAYADWASESQDWMKAFAQYPRLFTSGNTATVWGVSQAFNTKYVTLRPTIKYIPTHYFATKQIKSAMLLQHSSTGKVLRAPLIVFLPGIFGEVTVSTTVRVMDMLHSRGFHVLALPNPWTKEYIKERPLYDPGNIEGEADTVLDVIANAKKEIGEEYIERVSITGQSYGGFLSVVTAVREAHNEKKLINGSITAFSPPVFVLQALKRLDSGIKRTAKRFARRCSKGLRLGQLTYQLTTSSKESDFSGRLNECIDPILYQSFRYSLTTTAKALNEYKDAGEIPSCSTDRKEYKKWKNSMNFEELVKKFMPTQYPTFQNGTARSHLDFWVQQLTEDQISRLRIVTAKDDFLNEESDWDTPAFRPLIQSHQLLILPWGGHVGYFGLAVFEDFMDIAFAP